MSHTPGPWRHAKETIRHANGVSQTFNPDTVLTEDGESAICQVYGMPLNTTLEDIADDPRWSTGLANARLIAAAPELLAALETAMAWIDAVPKDAPLPAMPGFDRDWVDAAIARAKGEQA